MNIKIPSLLFAIVTPLAANAAHFSENLDLAKQCHQLSLKMSELSVLERVPFCKEKIMDAAVSVEYAAEHFMLESSAYSRSDLSLAIKVLSYTAVEDCSQANAILAAKNEVVKIYDLAHD